MKENKNEKGGRKERGELIGSRIILIGGGSLRTRENTLPEGGLSGGQGLGKQAADAWATYCWTRRPSSGPLCPVK